MKNLSRATILVFLFLTFPVQAANPLEVVINEIAWMGTKANSSDEWIELYNNTNQAISLGGWGLYEAGGETLIEPLTGIIDAKSYYLIERTDDTTVSDIAASQIPSGWGGSGLKNGGEHLQLLDQNSTIIDEVNCSNGWFAGEGKPDYKTMERKNPQNSGSNPDNWTSNNGIVINGQDTEGNLINGTPGSKNSVNVSTPRPETQPEPETKPETQSVKEQQKKPQPITYPPDILMSELTPSEPMEKEKSETQAPRVKEGLATVSEQLLKETPSFELFIIALSIAIFSGVIILILKRKVEEFRKID